MISFHILTDRVYPVHSGGLEWSVYRTALLLKQLIDKCTVYIYYLEEAENIHFQLKNGINYFCLNNIISQYIKPIHVEYKKVRYYYRLEFDILCDLLKRNMLSCNNIFISFYISTRGYIMERAAELFNVKHIAMVRGSDFLNDTFYPSLFSQIGYVCRNAERIITTNNSQKKSLSKIYNIEDSKFYVIYNSLPDNIVAAKVPSSSIQFFSDQGFSIKKGTLGLFKAIEIFLEKYTNDVKFIICGKTASSENIYWNEYRDKLKKKYPKHIEFYDYINNIKSIIENSTIYINTSLGEGCSNSVLYALATGIPAIISKVGCIPDMEPKMLEGVITFSPLDNNAIYNAIIEFAFSNKLYNFTSRANIIKKNFSFENEKKKWKNLLLELGVKI